MRPGLAGTVLDGLRGGVLVDIRDASGVIVHSLWKSAAIAWPASNGASAAFVRRDRKVAVRWRWELKRFRGGGRLGM
ncbi:hypothetical protein GCM10009736_04370 [Actinomadura bangladeshensis]